MIKIYIQPDDRYLLRFAFSPCYEIVTSLRVLRAPAYYAMHMPWITETRNALGNLDLGLLETLVPVKGYMPDFLTPLPNTPTPTIDEELDAILKMPVSVIQRDLHRAIEYDSSRREQLQPFIDSPKQVQQKVVKQISVYWKKALMPHWPRIRTVLEGDLMTRARSLAMNGPESVLSHLHPHIRYENGVLNIEKHGDVGVTTMGQGLLLVPSVFVAPHFLMFIDTPPTPVITYPARGVGNLWLGERKTKSAGLEELVGNSRANLLVALDSPKTTAQLATRLSLTPGAISQHIGVLKRAGVVETHRQGQTAFHRLTEAGEALVKIFD